MTAASSSTEVEVTRARIRARLALAFVLDDLGPTERAARLLTIVSDPAGSTKPLDAAYSAQLVRSQSHVELSDLAERALEHAGAATESARRLVRAVAWLEGRSRVHLCDVLAVQAAPRSNSTPVLACVKRALGAAQRADDLLRGIEGALDHDAARRVHATNAEGRLLYFDAVGRETTERAERVVRTLSGGEALFIAPRSVGFLATPGAAFTAGDLWRGFFAHVPHGEQAFAGWTAKPLHRAFDEVARRPVETAAPSEPDVLTSRARDLESVVAYAEAARQGLGTMPALSAHEPLFVSTGSVETVVADLRTCLAALTGTITSANDRLDIVRQALRRLGVQVRRTEEEAEAIGVAASAGGTTPSADPNSRFDSAFESVPETARRRVVSLTGGTLFARFASAAVLSESLASGLAPAPNELVWPERSIREGVLSALAGSELLYVCGTRPSEHGRAIDDVLEVIGAAQRTERRARRALAALTSARPVPTGRADREADAHDEADLLASELVARSVVESAQKRFAWLNLPPPTDLRRGSDSDARRAIDFVIRKTALVDDSDDDDEKATHRLELILTFAFSATTSRRLALMRMGDASRPTGASVDAAWLALLRVAHRTERLLYTERGLPQDVQKLETVTRLVSSPRYADVGRALGDGIEAIGWPLLDAVDHWALRQTNVLLLPESLTTASAVVREHREALEKRAVRVFALAGDARTAQVIELTQF